MTKREYLRHLYPQWSDLKYMPERQIIAIWYKEQKKNPVDLDNYTDTEIMIAKINKGIFTLNEYYKEKDYE